MLFGGSVLQECRDKGGGSMGRWSEGFRCEFAHDVVGCDDFGENCGEE